MQPASTPSRRQHRGRHVLVVVWTAALTIQTALATAMARARSDEGGLTTAEYVGLGALVVVAAGVVGTLVAAFVNAKAGQIVGTP